MRVRAWRWWLTGIIVYLVFLLATFPAGYAVAWLQKRAPDVRLTAVTGSVWSGAAQDLILKGRSWGALQWHFDWRAPFSGHLGYSLQLHSPDLDLHGRVAGGRGDELLLQDLRGQLGIAHLAPWLPLPPGSVGGTLKMQLARVVLVHRLPTLADGVVSLVNVNLLWPESLVLGSYQLKLQSQAHQPIQGSLMDTSGPLILQGSVSLTAGGRYTVQGTLVSRDPTNAALNNLLHYLPVNSAGQHPFSFDGQWPVGPE
ncbi:MAG: type II secretion system protein N [Gammaproteobacteria bacterium]